MDCWMDEEWMKYVWLVDGVGEVCGSLDGWVKRVARWVDG